MFLSSHHSVPFAFFLREYFTTLLPMLRKIKERFVDESTNEEAKVNIYGLKSLDQIANL